VHIRCELILPVSGPPIDLKASPLSLQPMTLPPIMLTMVSVCRVSSLNLLFVPSDHPHDRRHNVPKKLHVCNVNEKRIQTSSLRSVHHYDCPNTARVVLTIPIGLYSETAPPTDLADRISASYPHFLMAGIGKRTVLAIAQDDKSVRL
jgi:hypothetical protein